MDTGAGRADVSGKRVSEASASQVKFCLRQFCFMRWFSRVLEKVS